MNQIKFAISLISVGVVVAASALTYTHANFASTGSLISTEKSLNQRIDDQVKASDDKFSIILDTMTRIENKLNQRGQNECFKSK